MGTKQKSDQTKERRKGVAEGVDMAINHLEKSKFGEENDIRLLRELSAKIRKETPMTMATKLSPLAALYSASNAALAEVDQLRADGFPQPL